MSLQAAHDEETSVSLIRMPIYKYRAKKDPQNTVEGTVEALSEKEAIERVNQLGYVPVSIEEYQRSGQPKALTPDKPQGRVASREITTLSRQLSSLLKAGVPILNALDIISEQSENSNLKHIIRAIRNAVKDGASFSSALSQHRGVFSSLYLAMIRTGEDSGTLPEALLRIAEYRAKQEEMFARFRMALAYPVLMAIVGFGTVLFMLTFVMPRLTKIYSTMEQALPLPTLIVLSVSQYLRQWWPWIIVLVILLALALKKQSSTQAGRVSLSVIKLHIPIFGKFVLKAEIARFSRTLELLIKGGIPILKALEISIPVLENEIIKTHLRKSYKELEQGGSFGRSLKNSSIFPLFMSNLIVVGEESGRLDDALREVANAYERDTDEALKVMSSLLEPVMILVTGLIVGFIVIAMLLPIFEINVMTR